MAVHPPDPINDEWVGIYCTVYLYALDFRNEDTASSELTESFNYLQNLIFDNYCLNPNNYQFDQAGLDLTPSQCNISLLDKTMIIIKLVAMAKKDSHLAYIAAGPLEDILGMDANCDAKIDEAVSHNANMRKAICGVWASDRTTPKGKALHAILQKYGLQYASL